MTVILRHAYIPRFLRIMSTNFADFSLMLNSKKSAIVNIKNHTLRHNAKQILQIPYLKEYRYLGILVNTSGSIEPHIQYLKKRQNYLKNHLTFFSKELRWDVKHTLWSVYVKPYFTYCAPISTTQTKTL